MKKKIAWLMSVVLALSLSCPVLAAQTESELDRAGKYLKEHGIMVGDNNGDMIFGNNLTRAHLAVLLARLVGNPEHLAADQSFYASPAHPAAISVSDPAAPTTHPLITVSPPTPAASSLFLMDSSTQTVASVHCAFLPWI